MNQGGWPGLIEGPLHAGDLKRYTFATDRTGIGAASITSRPWLKVSDHTRIKTVSGGKFAILLVLTQNLPKHAIHI